MANPQFSEDMELTGRKVAVSYADYNQVLNVAAGASAIISITPPAGELWRIKRLKLTAPIPSGGTAGTHGLYVGSGSTNGGKQWALAAISNYNLSVDVSYNYIYSATTKYPSTEQAQQQAILSLAATNNHPLIVFYDNQATGSTQTGTIIVTIVREVEYIVS